MMRIVVENVLDAIKDDRRVIVRRNCEGDAYRSTFAGLFGLRLERPTLFSPSNGVALSRVFHRENSQCDDAVD